MNPEYRIRIDEFFEAQKDAMIDDIKALVEIPSFRGEAQEGMPFGVGPLTALHKATELLEREGLAVRNWDNQVVTGDLTDLAPGLDILAHLDVVPAEDNWHIGKPFDPEVIDGKLYGRGTADDKGPAVAALYAMKCVRALGLPLKKNVRLILGTDEECGMSDVAYYYSQVPEAPMTFTPDAEFPLINLEKGHYICELGADFVSDARLPYIASADCGYKFNVIPENGKAVVVGMTPEALAPYLSAAAEKTGADFTATALDGGSVILCKGAAGHASLPESAVNAATALLSLLASLPCADSEGFRYVRALERLFPHGDYYGKAVGIAQEDEISGRLTCSADILRIDETSVFLCFDSRCPVCATDANTREVVNAAAAAAGLKVTEGRVVPPHYVPADTELIRTLLRAYEDWTGLHGEPLAIGGGTYVHSLKSGVAFGCGMEGIDNRLHNGDEFIGVEQLLLSAKIFTQAILDLCC